MGIVVSACLLTNRESVSLLGRLNTWNCPVRSVCSFSIKFGVRWKAMNVVSARVNVLGVSITACGMPMDGSSPQRRSPSGMRSMSRHSLEDARNALKALKRITIEPKAKEALEKVHAFLDENVDGMITYLKVPGVTRNSLAEFWHEDTAESGGGA